MIGEFLASRAGGALGFFLGGVGAIWLTIAAIDAAARAQGF